MLEYMLNNQKTSFSDNPSSDINKEQWILWALSPIGQKFILWNVKSLILYIVFMDTKLYPLLPQTSLPERLSVGGESTWYKHDMKYLSGCTCMKLWRPYTNSHPVVAGIKTTETRDQSLTKPVLEKYLVYSRSNLIFNLLFIHSKIALHVINWKFFFLLYKSLQRKINKSFIYYWKIGSEVNRCHFL